MGLKKLGIIQLSRSSDSLYTKLVNLKNLPWELLV